MSKDKYRDMDNVDFVAAEMRQRKELAKRVKALADKERQKLINHAEYERARKWKQN